MKWNDIQRISTLIEEIDNWGAKVEEIGVSGEGRSILVVTLGNQQAARTIVIVADYHADEIIGPLAAIPDPNLTATQLLSSQC